MKNNKLPAYAQPIATEPGSKPIATYEMDPDLAGYTKQEKGALIMAAALVGRYNLKTPEDQHIIAQLSNELAKAVLEEANK